MPPGCIELIFEKSSRSRVDAEINSNKVSLRPMKVGEDPISGGMRGNGRDNGVFHGVHDEVDENPRPNEESDNFESFRWEAGSCGVCRFGNVCRFGVTVCKFLVC